MNSRLTLIIVVLLVLAPAVWVISSADVETPAVAEAAAEVVAGDTAAVQTPPAEEGPSSLFPPLTLKSLEKAAEPRTPSIHPPVILMDEDMEPVIRSGRPLSLAATCGGCHNVDYIARNNYHSQVGLNELTPPGQAKSGRAWDVSPGMFGRWNPLTYRTLSPEGFDEIDMGTADWIMVMGPRHVGGGPAVTSRFTGRPLTETRADDPKNPDAFVLDPITRKPAAWNWQESGVMELNCLLCHVKDPNNAQRVAEIKKGRFGWASSATLLGSGVAERDGGEIKWSAKAFAEDGSVRPEYFRVSDPRSGNCRICHGSACRCSDPVIFENSLDNWGTETTGEIFSPDPVDRSGMNLKGKESLHLPWDVHAQRLLQCSNCHHSMNNPEYNEETGDERPGHLRFDARKLGFGEYLETPDHNLAKGHSAQGTVARAMDGSMRDCRDCHDAEARHDFLPYKKLHFQKLSCQTCHVQRVLAPARMSTDWTLLDSAGEPLVTHRGVRGRVNDPASIIDGYTPVLLMHEEDDGEYRLGPHNVITSWFWVEGDPERPVREADLKAAFLEKDGTYRPEYVRALDENGDGKLEENELRLGSAAKVEAIKKLLESAGVKAPRIKGEIQPYTLSHGVASGDYALHCCQCCHGKNSRAIQDVKLSDYAPGAAEPGPVTDARILLHGKIETGKDGKVYCTPTLDPGNLYLHGTQRVQWLDWIGILAVIGSFLGVAAHGTLRFASSRIKKAE